MINMRLVILSAAHTHTPLSQLHTKLLRRAEIYLAGRICYCDCPLRCGLYFVCMCGLGVFLFVYILWLSVWCIKQDVISVVVWIYVNGVSVFDTNKIVYFLFHFLSFFLSVIRSLSCSPSISLSVCIWVYMSVLCWFNFGCQKLYRFFFG